MRIFHSSFKVSVKGLACLVVLMAVASATGTLEGNRLQNLKAVLTGQSLASRSAMASSAPLKGHAASHLLTVYKDFFSNDEVLTDEYPQTLEYQGTAIFVKSKYVEAPNGVDMMPDVVYGNNLVKIELEKPKFKDVTKYYLRRLKSNLEDSPNKAEVPRFETGASDLIKFLVSKFDELTFYLGSSDNSEGMVIVSLLLGEDEAPTFIYWADGLSKVVYNS